MKIPMKLRQKVKDPSGVVQRLIERAKRKLTITSAGVNQSNC